MTTTTDGNFVNDAMVDLLIYSCNSLSTKKCIGKILQRSEEEIVILLNEYINKLDTRFTDNLKYACDIVIRLREDYNYSTIFLQG